MGQRGRPQTPGLRWHGGKGQWFRLFDGKARYFGPVGIKSKTPDETVKNAAQNAWYAWEVERMFEQARQQGAADFAVIDQKIDALTPEHRTQLEQANPTDYIKLSDQLLHGQQSPEAAPAPITVKDVVAVYVEYLRQQAESNRKKRRHYLDAKNRLAQFTGEDTKDTSKPWTFPQADLPITALTREHFRIYRDKLNRYANEGKFSQDSVNKFFRLVKGSFNCASREKGKEHGYSTPALPEYLSLLKTKATPETDTEVFTPEHIKAMTENFDKKFHAITLLSLNCALSNTDAAYITWGCIDWDQQQFDSARTKQLGIRRTPLWDRTIKALKEWKAECPFATGDDNFVFPNKDGVCFIQETEKSINDNLSRRFSDKLEAIGLKQFKGCEMSFEILRKSAATNALGANSDDTAVKMLLGDASGEIWKKHYVMTRGQNAKVKTATDTLEAYYFPQEQEKTS